MPDIVLIHIDFPCRNAQEPLLGNLGAIDPSLTHCRQDYCQFYYWYDKDKDAFMFHLGKLNSTFLKNSKILIDEQECSIIRAAGSFNDRLLTPVLCSNKKHSRYTLYSQTDIRNAGFSDEVNSANLVRNALVDLKNHNPNLNVQKYMQTLGIPLLRETNEMASKSPGKRNKDGARSLHLYMQNGWNGSVYDSVYGANYNGKSILPFNIETIRPCFEGLFLLLAAGVSHNDIKPENIVSNDRNYFLIDFGVIEEYKNNPNLFATQVPTPGANEKGTAYYLYPTWGDNKIKPSPAKKNIYALCLSFIEVSEKIPNDIQQISSNPIALCFRVS